MSLTPLELLERIERCFDEGEIETLTWRTPGEGLSVSRADAAVKVIHRPSGLEVVCEEYPSQILNRVAALLELLNRLLEEARGDD